MSPEKLPLKIGFAFYAVCGLLVWKVFSITYVFGFDYRIYHQAAEAALTGVSPYFPYVVGTSFLYHPAFLLLIAPLTLFDATAAALIWLAVSAGLYAATWRMLARRIALPQAYKSYLFALLVVSSSAAESFWMGQVNALVVFLLTVSFVQAEKRPAWAGMALAVAVVCKTSPVIFFVYFLLRGRWQVAAWGAATLAALSLASLLAFGWPMFADFLNVGGQLTAQPTASGVNFALALQLTRIGIPIELGVWIQRGIAGALIGSALFFAARRRSPMLTFAAMTVGMVLASPLLWGHHGVLALSAIVLFAQYRWNWTLLILCLLQFEFFASYILGVPGVLLLTLGWIALTAGLLYELSLARLEVTEPAPSPLA